MTNTWRWFLLWLFFFSLSRDVELQCKHTQESCVEGHSMVDFFFFSFCLFDSKWGAVHSEWPKFGTYLGHYKNIYFFCWTEVQGESNRIMLTILGFLLLSEFNKKGFYFQLDCKLAVIKIWFLEWRFFFRVLFS